MTHDTQELVARLRLQKHTDEMERHEVINACFESAYNHLIGDCREAADALTAQAEEIRALRERNAEMEAALRELLGILEIASVMPDAIQKVYVPKMDAPELSRARAALAGKGEA